MLNSFKCDTFILLNYYRIITGNGQHVSHTGHMPDEKGAGGIILRKQTPSLILSVLSAVLLLTGCGKSGTADELNSYQASMSTFCDNISYLNDQINSLDGTGESDVETLLKHLDTLDEQFAQMAELTVPDEFAAIEKLADEASENMTMAVSYYHEAYDSDTFNQNYADAAYEYYTRANTRLGYILKILHGEEITDDNIKYITDDAESEE